MTALTWPAVLARRTRRQHLIELSRAERAGVEAEAAALAEFLGGDELELSLV